MSTNDTGGPKEPQEAYDIVGDSPEMRRIRASIARIARADGTVLIAGERGVGKELLARTIHGRSPRSGRPFAAVRSDVHGEAVLGAALEPARRCRGPSSGGGASDDRPGGDAIAGPGTLFLTDIAALSPAMQLSLLRFLKERQFRRAGRGAAGADGRAVLPRIVAATTRDLARLVEAGEFRADLFYRVSAVAVHVPPLRLRRADILPLARHFAERFAAETGRDLRGFSRAAERVLEAHAWPGNVAELEGVVERAVVFETSNRVEVGSLALSGAPNPDARAEAAPAGSSAADRPDDTSGLRLPDSGFVLERHVESLEREYLARALRQAGGVKVRAAALLGMSFRSFRYYVKKYDLG